VTADPNLARNKTPAASLGAERPSTQPNGGSVTAMQAPPATLDQHGYTTFELWVHRITVLMFVFVCAVVGVLLVILPWRPEWTDNHLLLASPQLRSLVASVFVRGLCSGLGVLDIWIGFWEAVNYQEIKRP
jgi:hypothetical protein